MHTRAHIFAVLSRRFFPTFLARAYAFCAFHAYQSAYFCALFPVSFCLKQDLADGQDYQECLWLLTFSPLISALIISGSCVFSPGFRAAELRSCSPGTGQAGGIRTGSVQDSLVYEGVLFVWQAKLCQGCGAGVPSGLHAKRPSTLYRISGWLSRGNVEF